MWHMVTHINVFVKVFYLFGWCFTLHSLIQLEFRLEESWQSLGRTKVPAGCSKTLQQVWLEEPICGLDMGTHRARIDGTRLTLQPWHTSSLSRAWPKHSLLRRLFQILKRRPGFDYVNKIYLGNFNVKHNYVDNTEGGFIFKVLFFILTFIRPFHLKCRHFTARARGIWPIAQSTVIG